MLVRARVTILVVLALFVFSACQSREEKERTLTQQCKQEAPCKKQGLCTGLCSPEPCRCVVASNADCAQSLGCSSTGQCTVKDGKCVVATNNDCSRATPCKASGYCTAKDGVCVVSSDSDCSQSDICKNQQKCVARNGACADPSFNPALLNPALTNEQAPEKFKVKFTTTKGDFVVEVTRAWAPLGAERLYNLAKIGYYNDVAFYRVDDSSAEFGIHGKPEVSAAWAEVAIKDDPPKQPNDRGYVRARPNARWGPLVVYLKNSRELDQVGYAPVGRVIQGMNVLDSLSKAKGDIARVQAGGNSYLRASLPQLDYVKSASLL
jgi:peptidyl-prolyl cis-trans isomerase A (cyclophilin A)